MELDRVTCDRARRSRDARFDGRFFIGVTTTRVYCRPICPVRAPKDEHVRYFASAAAAEAGGFRPCLRCRPEASPGTPAWLGTSGVVSRALRLISDGALDAEGVERLADRLGVTGRHLRRLFLQHLGAAPLDVALTRRVHFAKKLLDETTLAMNQVAFASGFRSVRRFNSQIRRTYARTPTGLRRLARRLGAAEPSDVRPAQGGRECYRFRLAYRAPYDWDAVLAFLGARATPGVESVAGGRYRRSIRIDANDGIVDVSRLESRSALALEVRFPDPRRLLFIVERMRRMFDVGADPAAIGDQLGADPLLREPLSRHPGIRTPGAWDGFELAVRAILGQQISVRAATTIAGRIASMFGSPLVDGQGLDRLFPTAAQLADAPVERAGVMPARAATIRALARQVADGTLSFGSCADEPATLSALLALPGIGDWTAEYIAMRAFAEPDAFPSGDLVLRRAAGGCTARELGRTSNAWRPWRAYAVMLLWQDATDRHDQSRTMKDGRPAQSSTLVDGAGSRADMVAAHGSR
jgi:AraC family transcriptional regulator, regulatory protein of adaptative response / DNA-3-methyladenine glycosylase II